MHATGRAFVTEVAPVQVGPITVLSALPAVACHPNHARKGGMTTLAHDGPRAVIGGVDTHKDAHVAAVIDEGASSTG